MARFDKNSLPAKKLSPARRQGRCQIVETEKLVFEGVSGVELRVSWDDKGRKDD